MVNFFLVSPSSYFIAAPPYFTQSPRNQTIPKGQTAKFPCNARGDPTPSIKWYKSNVPVDSGENLVILSNGTLLVTRVTQLDSGWFTCRAENQAGTKEVKAFLLVAGMEVVNHSLSCLLYSLYFKNISRKRNNIRFTSGRSRHQKGSLFNKIFVLSQFLSGCLSFVSRDVGPKL